VSDQLLTALTTEHFTLAGQRASTIGESNARSALYLLSVSSTLVAIGFVSQLSTTGELFRVFTLTVLPTLLVLGLLTFLRLVEVSIEDFRYGQAINRIRRYYLELAGDRRGYFLLSGHDDAAGVWENMGLGRRPSRWHSYFTMPIAIGFINSVIGGGAVALVVGVAGGGPLAVPVAAGAAFALASLMLHYRYDERCFERPTREPALFPSTGG